jgi:hypothetical protein
MKLQVALRNPNVLGSPMPPPLMPRLLCLPLVFWQERLLLREPINQRSQSSQTHRVDKLTLMLIYVTKNINREKPSEELQICICTSLCNVVKQRLLCEYPLAWNKAKNTPIQQDIIPVGQLLNLHVLSILPPTIPPFPFLSPS